MKVLGIKTSIWYKSIHVFFACAWFGSVLSVILIYLLSNQTTSIETLRNNSDLMENIDKFIIIPSSLACYLFGLLISWRTNWGFFKYKWVAVKLILGTGLILFGIIFLGPWIMESSSISELGKLHDLQNKLGVSMIGQAIVIGVTILISTIKPWGKIKS
ncbi:MAG: hypothetical protein GY810_13030 [Aureispira sp.]|nr:hypothetical protein [Aureispira sp.]